MSRLAISVADWFGVPDSEENATFGAIRIDTSGGAPWTEVHDTFAKATRSTIHVPASLVAEWFLTRWWRLRWETRPNSPGLDWRKAHSMAALGGGYAWPPIEIWGDGEFVQMSMQPEEKADVAGIRYLSSGFAEVDGADFDAAIEAFCGAVEQRIAIEPSLSNTIRELATELRYERTDPDLARRCRWEARAGFDPGDPLDDWIASLDRLAKEVGDTAMEDLLAQSADSEDLSKAFDAVKHAQVSVDLGSVPAAPRRHRGQRPWERGARAAVAARKAFNISEGPVSNDKLAEILGTRMPLSPDAAPASGIGGGYRSDDGSSSTRVLITNRHPDSQRFYLCRLLGTASAMPKEDAFLPITDAPTALQKLGRSFSQEFLCPWQELDAFTDAHGTGDAGISRAADRYQVSQLLIASTLVNRGKIDRVRLERFD